MITLIAGPMTSGKSTELFRQMERKHIAGKKVLYVCPSLDTREFFARGIPRSRLFEVASCETVKDWNLVDETVVIIHGIGQGIVREAVHEELKHNKNVLKYWVDVFNPGVTVVKIKISLE